MTDLSRSGVGVEPQPTEALWAAVAKLTQPTRVMLARDEPEWVRDLRDQSDGFCYVDAYRAATARSALIPSLWDQAVAALTGGEVGGGTGSKPLRERSLADLDLMEIIGIVRDTTRRELEKRAKAEDRPLPADVPGQIRRLVSVAIRDEPDALWWWTYRVAQWGRLLETYLNAAEHAPKPTRLRNTACPLCHTKQLIVEQDGENMVVPPLVVDYRDGYVRAARCEACSATWFRGAELAELARLVGAPGGEMLTA
jgi:hypothetical protein